MKKVTAITSLVVVTVAAVLTTTVYELANSPTYDPPADPSYASTVAPSPPPRENWAQDFRSFRRGVELFFSREQPPYKNPNPTPAEYYAQHPEAAPLPPEVSCLGAKDKIQASIAQRGNVPLDKAKAFIPSLVLSMNLGKDGERPAKSFDIKYVRTVSSVSPERGVTCEADVYFYTDSDETEANANITSLDGNLVLITSDPVDLRYTVQLTDDDQVYWKYEWSLDQN